MKETLNLTESQIKNWWSEKRTNYNLGLVVSGILAFVLYVILGVNLIMPYDDDFEITLFTIVPQGIGYLVMILIANLLYSLGVSCDLNYNKENTEKFRKNLFHLGFWISVSLPFLAPLGILISYFLEFY
ncbi:hypothetical protein LNP04_14270 [Chryseobacterium sp. C-71]|uniref:hypothetical protein n=1 Tax=Chryseobacterium sp. C-71 TaxID=2893882 RepID=UPI001E509FF3|nr:hypothetical protein [Chryseobacterium sp. C-71]UFH31134.1 hypothetical protein LNP04_14270 [Chryseobacterium sp. C-71]